ncbi:MAG TPA: hypothetical protein VGR28_09545 [Candidatus Thermoplasmatota archaeon]|jgi:hypothetical protein|nr:hypothetical protein [Candidatus Thermoplasmatota archaeon]
MRLALAAGVLLLVLGAAAGWLTFEFQADSRDAAFGPAEQKLASQTGALGGVVTLALLALGTGLVMWARPRGDA